MCVLQAKADGLLVWQALDGSRLLLRGDVWLFADNLLRDAM